MIEGPAEFIALQTGMISMAEFRERMSAFSAGPPFAVAAPRSAWDVSIQLDRDIPWNDVCHYEDVSRKPGAGTEGIVRVIPRGRRSRGPHAVTSWTVVTRAPSHGEGIDLLKAAEPLLRDELVNRYWPGARYFRIADGRLAEGLACGTVEAGKAEAGLHRKASDDLRARIEAERRAAEAALQAARGTRAALAAISAELAGARLNSALSPCAHPDAEPVNLLVTGETVAWVCPDCPADLPADWR